MEVIESYRVLELDVGASRAAMDAAYCRLVERWHPDRAASAGPEAILTAQRMVQTINDAYHTLAKIAPGSNVRTASETAGNQETAKLKEESKTQHAGYKSVEPESRPEPGLGKQERESGSQNPVAGIPHPESAKLNLESEIGKLRPGSQSLSGGNQGPESEIYAPESKPATPPAPLLANAIPTLAKTKPRLPPLVGGQPSLGRSPPPPPPPSAETWASRPPAVSGAPSTSIPRSLPPPLTKPLPPVATPPPSSRPTSIPPAPPPVPGKPSALESLDAPPTAAVRPKVPGLYETLLPPGSALRRFGPLILIAILITVLLLGKCAFSSSRSKGPQAADPKTTGRVVVKSNRANATIEATRVPSPGDATTASADGAVDQLLSGLPPGKYAITARADGWPEIRTQVNVDAERTTEVAMNFKSGSLRLESDPAGAIVRLGTAVLGRTPLVVPQLAPGECHLSIEYPSWPAVAFKTTIAENVEATGSVRLPHGKLVVETTPSGISVMLAGRALGSTPLTLEPFPAGTNKLTLRAKDFPPLDVSVTMEDRGEVKVHPQLGSVFPALNPAALLRALWVRDDPDKIAPPLEGVTGAFQSRNGVVKNLNRKWLFERWLRKRYGFTGLVKSYDPVTGQVEFVEQQSELSKYRVLAMLAPEVRNDPDLTTQLIKGASFALYGQLTAVEEPRWPSKVITFELSAAAPLQ